MRDGTAATQMVTGTTPKLTVTDSTFTNIVARLSGGAFFIDNPYLQAVSYSGCTFTNIKALAGNGGVFNVKRLTGKLTLSNGVLTDFSAINNPLTS